MFYLSTFLPKKPTDVELKVIKEMFEASVDGQPYDTDRWGQYYRPAGVSATAGSSASHSDEEAAPAAVAKSVVESSPFVDDEPAAPSAPIEAAKPATQKAEDILAMIRSRQQK